MNKKNWTIFGVCFLFTAIGTYNSVVITSTSALENANHSLVKRLDHEGLNRPARMVASNTTWKKLHAITPQKQVAQLAVASKEVPTAVVDSHIAQDLNLSLVEVINSQGQANTDFTGVLTTNGSQIETLEISLPQGLGISVSYAEINGNVFEYEMNGQTFSGMLYQVDQNAYMVSFTAGELAGTRLRFQSSSQMEEMGAADVAHVDVGQFGQEGYEAEELANLDRQLQDEGLAGASFKF